jgi:hypothetical protein
MSNNAGNIKHLFQLKQSQTVTQSTNWIRCDEPVSALETFA